MKTVVWLSIFVIVFTATAAAQPQIAANGVLNAASDALELAGPIPPSHRVLSFRFMA